MNLNFKDVRYLSAAETAKIIRKRLRNEFPGVKFYVRTGRGGGSVNVQWLDGPTDDAVNSVVAQYSGGDFDGMIDMMTYFYHWLLPDSSTVVAHGQGTEGSRGTIPAVSNDKPHPQAELVSFGARFVFLSRHYSRDMVEMVGRQVNKEHGWDIPEIRDSKWWATKAKMFPTAYFKWDHTKRVPGTCRTPELTEEFNSALICTSAFVEPMV